MPGPVEPTRSSPHLDTSWINSLKSQALGRCSINSHGEKSKLQNVSYKNSCDRPEHKLAETINQQESMTMNIIVCFLEVGILICWCVNEARQAHTMRFIAQSELQIQINVP